MADVQRVSVPAQPATQSALSDLDLRVIAFEREWADRVGAKEAAIRSEFGLSAARYYQVLYDVIDTPAALRHDPVLVRRLQRVRDARARSRAARSFRVDTYRVDPQTTQDTTD